MAVFTVTLASRLIEAGLIQFGWFQRDGAALPFALHLDMLASYPDILEAAANEAVAWLSDLGVNRLLCAADSIPFGVAVSLRSAIPLVYSRGTSEPPVDDLVGAFDIGHPALLLTNSVGWQDAPSQLVNAARRVGLEVHTLLTILEARPVSQPDHIPVLPLLRLTDVVRDRSASGRLAAGHTRAVLEWIEAET